MPELPDVEAYVSCLAPRIVGRRLECIRPLRPFVLCSVAPPLEEAAGRSVLSAARLGKRVAYASNESNYCPACQTGGKLLADRTLSRLLERDWPRTLEELEALKQAR